MASKVINVSLPEKWGQIIEEMSALTGESMASIVTRSVIKDMELAIATGYMDKLRSEKSV